MFGGNITQHAKRRWHHIRDDDSRSRGASLVEYALLLILVLVVAFVSVGFLGDSVVAIFDATTTSFDTVPKTTN